MTACETFWQDYLRSLPPSHHHRGIEPDAFAFGGSVAMDLADELAALVLAGGKRGTASLAIEYTSLGERLPVRGDPSIVLDGRGTPVAIIERVEVVTVPFGDVPASFAAIEGEGDGSLASWRSAHRAYFSAVCAALGGTFGDTTPVLCQTFRVVWP